MQTRFEYLGPKRALFAWAISITALGCDWFGEQTTEARGESPAEMRLVQNPPKSDGRAPAAEEDPPEIVARLEQGSWGPNLEASCLENEQLITFSSDLKQMEMKWLKPKKDGSVIAPAVYEVLQVEDRFVRAKLEGEKRTTSGGELVIWDLVLQNEDEICWHRTDWPAGACTASAPRCRSRRPSE